MSQIEGTREECEAIIAAEDTQRGYPVRNKPPRYRVQPLRPSPATWDGVPPVPPGYTATTAVPEEHPRIRGRFAVPVDGAAMRARVVGGTFAGRLVRDADVVERDAADWSRDEPAPVDGE